jgi:hypothetical protein
MDWSGVERSDFIQITKDRLERLAEHGACGIKFWKDFGLTDPARRERQSSAD